MVKKFIGEILEEVNNDPKLIDQYKNNQALKFVFEHAYMKDKKFNLPKGEPPFKKAAQPLGMCETHLGFEARKFYVFCREDLTAFKRESLFVNLLESLHPSEAEILIAIKDQKLHKKFRNVTRKFAIRHGFIPKETEEGEEDACEGDD